MKKFSRVLVVPAALLVANASATCPLFTNTLVKELHHNKALIGASIVADKVYNKDEHAKKAFAVTLAEAAKNGTAHDFAERFVVDYAIRVASDKIGVNGMRDAAVQKLDVLPQGMARDLVNPVVAGVAEVVTHPEALTYVVMNVVLPMVHGGNAAQK
jgi:hypothetical protein